MQVIQDRLLEQDIETHRALNDNQIPPPLESFEKHVVESNADLDLKDKSSSLNMVISSCMRDIYHYARVSGLHVLECVMNTALSAVKSEKLQEACHVCPVFSLTYIREYGYFCNHICLSEC